MEGSLFLYPAWNFPSSSVRLCPALSDNLPGYYCLDSLLCDPDDSHAPLRVFHCSSGSAFKKPDAKNRDALYVPCAAEVWFEAVSSLAQGLLLS